MSTNPRVGRYVYESEGSVHVEAMREQVTVYLPHSGLNVTLSMISACCLLVDG